MAHLAHCSDNEYRLATSPKAASVATSTLSTSASLSAVDMNQLCLGCTKTPRAAHFKKANSGALIQCEQLKQNEVRLQSLADQCPFRSKPVTPMSSRVSRSARMA